MKGGGSLDEENWTKSLKSLLGIHQCFSAKVLFPFRPTNAVQTYLQTCHDPLPLEGSRTSSLGIKKLKQRVGVKKSLRNQGRE